MQLVEILNPKSEIINNTKIEFRYLNLFRVWCLRFRIFKQIQGADWRKEDK